MAHDQESIMAGVIAKLVASTGAGTFYESVGGRIYRTIAPTDKTLPLCIVSVIDDPPDRYFGAADTYADIGITLHGARDAGETALQAIAAKLFTLLDSAALTITGHVGGQAWVQNRGSAIPDDDRISINTLWGIAATAA